MSEKEKLEKLLEFDSHNREEVFQWTRQAEALLRANLRDMSCRSSIDQLIRFGRDDFFGHFTKVKFELQRLYDDRYSCIIAPKTDTNSKVVFIAMRFSNDMQVIFDDIYKPICKNFGLKAIRIDEQYFTGSIIDQIKKSISNAIFMIADLTHNCAGVYYEAGIAAGLQMCNHPIQVIWTCREEEFHCEKVHFDVQGDNILIYKDPYDLKNKLSNILQSLLRELENKV